MTGFLRNLFGADKATDAANAASATQAAAADDSARIQSEAALKAAQMQADAYRYGTDASVKAQQDALAYLREREAVPSAIRDEALQGLSGFYQIPGAMAQPRSQQELIQEAMNSPLYAAIMGTKQDGVDEMARYASATGGLRSGNAQAAFAREGQRVSNQALLDSFNQVQGREDYNIRRADAERGLHLSGLSGLAGLAGNDAAIADLMAGIGSTQGAGAVGAGNALAQGQFGSGSALAQGVLGAGQARAGGITAGAQAQSSALNNVFNTILGGLQAYVGGGGEFSDIRLKDNIRYFGNVDGFDLYEWDWNKTAQDKFGLEGSGRGVIAHHVFETHPEAIGVQDGYLTVKYDLLLKRAA